MNKFTFLNSTPFLVITLVCLVIAISLGVLSIYPNYKELNSFQKQIEQKENDLQNIKIYVSKLRELKAKLADYGPDLEKIKSSLPSNPSVPSLFNFFQQASSQSGLILTSIGDPKMSSLGEKANIQEIETSLGIAGSYPAFKNFLFTLEKSARIIEVETVSFPSPQEGSLFNFDITIKTHSY